MGSTAPGEVLRSDRHDSALPACPSSRASDRRSRTDTSCAEEGARSKGRKAVRRCHRIESGSARHGAQGATAKVVSRARGKDEGRSLREIVQEIKARNSNNGGGRKAKGGPWTGEEDDMLTTIMTDRDKKSWTWQQRAKFLDKKMHDSCAVARGRTPTQCMHRWQKVLDPGVTKGAWQKSEDAVLHEAVGAFRQDAAVNWSEVAKKISGRSGKQCRERWRNHLDPKVNKGGWTSEEDDILFSAQKLFDTRWCEIAKLLPGRTENHVKNRYHSSARSEWWNKCRTASGHAADKMAAAILQKKLLDSLAQDAKRTTLQRSLKQKRPPPTRDVSARRRPHKKRKAEDAMSSSTSTRPSSRRKIRPDSERETNRRSMAPHLNGPPLDMDAVLLPEAGRSSPSEAKTRKTQDRSERSVTVAFPKAPSRSESEGPAISKARPRLPCPTEGSMGTLKPCSRARPLSASCVTYDRLRNERAAEPPCDRGRSNGASRCTPANGKPIEGAGESSEAAAKEVVMASGDGLPPSRARLIPEEAPSRQHLVRNRSWVVSEAAAAMAGAVRAAAAAAAGAAVAGGILANGDAADDGVARGASDHLAIFANPAKERGQVQPTRVRSGCSNHDNSLKAFRGNLAVSGFAACSVPHVVDRRGLVTETGSHFPEALSVSGSAHHTSGPELCKACSTPDGGAGVAAVEIRTGGDIGPQNHNLHRDRVPIVPTADDALSDGSGVALCEDSDLLASILDECAKSSVDNGVSPVNDLDRRTEIEEEEYRKGRDRKRKHAHTHSSCERMDGTRNQKAARTAERAPEQGQKGLGVETSQEADLFFRHQFATSTEFSPEYAASTEVFGDDYDGLQCDGAAVASVTRDALLHWDLEL